MRETLPPSTKTPRGSIETFAETQCESSGSIERGKKRVDERDSPSFDEDLRRRPSTKTPSKSIEKKPPTSAETQCESSGSGGRGRRREERGFGETDPPPENSREREREILTLTPSDEEVMRCLRAHMA